MKDYKEIWTTSNNAGEGYAVGDEDHDINSIDELGELAINSEDNDGYAVYRDGDDEVIVADANGPWAVNA